MTKPPSDNPPQERPATKSTSEQARAAREAVALRANLLKRKNQVRQREDAKAKPDR